MTKKQLFNLLNKEQQMDVVKTLACYDEVHIEFYNGEFHVEINWTLRSGYPRDFKFLGEFKREDFYKEINCNYELDWYNFWNNKERKGEVNNHGTWQKDFEKLYEPIYQQAYNYFIKVNA